MLSALHMRAVTVQLYLSTKLLYLSTDRQLPGYWNTKFRRSTACDILFLTDFEVSTGIHTAVAGKFLNTY
eukprot:SAG31_NODE_19537_length_599_cov_0.992000_2_plen_70_part_00